MERFSTRTGKISVEPQQPVFISLDDSTIEAEMDTDSGTVTFIRQDGTTPELVTGLVAPSPLSPHK